MARANRPRLAALLILFGGPAVIGAAVLASFIARPSKTASIQPEASRVVASAAQPRPVSTPEPTLVIKHVLDIPSIAFGDWAWDEAGAPPGRLVMTVDLKAQTVSVFRSGHEIGTAAILYGANDKPTPLGRFPILEKDRDHVSNLYGAPMPFMLRLTDDGVAIHGSEVKWGYATHGCIGVPTAFAERLFAAASVGDVVIVTRGKLLKLGDRIN